MNHATSVVTLRSGHHSGGERKTSPAERHADRPIGGASGRKKTWCLAWSSATQIAFVKEMMRYLFC